MMWIAGLLRGLVGHRNMDLRSHFVNLHNTSTTLARWRRLRTLFLKVSLLETESDLVDRRTHTIHEAQAGPTLNAR
jgi:hypothetical protein